MPKAALRAPRDSTPGSGAHAPGNPSRALRAEGLQYQSPVWSTQRVRSTRPSCTTTPLAEFRSFMPGV